MAWGILGHEQLVERLCTGLKNAQLPHALLLTGPRGVGKRTLALALARVLNCSGAEPPCGVCRTCRLTERGSYPDAHLIELREGRQRIGIAEIQALQSELIRRPSEGPWRIAIIAEAERLSTEAENCLLKTLEEPPPHAIIILTVEEAEALLPTTVSRCRRLRLRPVPAGVIVDYLTGQLGIARDQATLLAQVAEGRPGWAIAAAREPRRVETYQAAIARLGQVVEGSPLTRLAISRELAESWSGHSEQVREELRVWVRWWRSLLLAKLSVARSASLDGADLQNRQCAERFTLEQLRGALQTLLQARSDLDQNVNPRLALDVAVLRLPRPTEA